jgi:outer membrane protein assembly factor BamA
MWPAWLAERFLLMKKITMGLRGLTWSVLASSLLVTLPAWAVDPFTLRDIRIEGLQRIEPGTVFASLPFRIGTSTATTRDQPRFALCSALACSATCACR